MYCFVYGYMGLLLSGDAVQWGGGGGGVTHKRKFTLFTTRDTYNSTH